MSVKTASSRRRAKPQPAFPSRRIKIERTVSEPRPMTPTSAPSPTPEPMQGPDPGPEPELEDLIIAPANALDWGALVRWLTPVVRDLLAAYKWRSDLPNDDLVARRLHDAIVIARQSGEPWAQSHLGELS